jgi:cyclic pyranopterin phosphate synthase
VTKAGRELTPHLVTQVASIFMRSGGTAVKLTGGDPALWEPLIACVRQLKREVGVPHVEVISRHPRIGHLAKGLAEVGTDVINMSIDTLDPVRHRQITGVADLDQVLEAAATCASTGMHCKINTVVMAGVNDCEIEALIEFCERIGAHSLKLLDLITDLEDGTESYASRLVRMQGRTPRQLYQPMTPITARLRARAVATREIHQGGLGHPMLGLRMPSGLEVIVKDHHAGAWYGSICAGCRHYPCHDALMALRLTADARLQFCLLREDIAVDLAPLIAAGEEALERTITEALSIYDTATLRASEEVAWIGR